MKNSKWQYVLAIALFLVGGGLLFTYDFYLQPYVFAKEVVKVKTDVNGLPKSYELSAADVYLDSVPSAHVPSGAFTDINEVLGLKLNTTLSDNVILTSSLLDTNHLQPGPNEGIFPLPKTAIYAINGSLRAGDKVDIYLVQDSEKMRSQNQFDPATGEMKNEQVSLETSDVFSTDVSVVYVRTEENNDVKDTEEGKSTNRSTSTGKVATPELLLDKELGKELGDRLAKGYTLWIVRVE